MGQESAATVLGHAVDRPAGQLVARDGEMFGEFVNAWVGWLGYAKEISETRELPRQRSARKTGRAGVQPDVEKGPKRDLCRARSCDVRALPKWSAFVEVSLELTETAVETLELRTRDGTGHQDMKVVEHHDAGERSRKNLGQLSPQPDLRFTALQW